MIFFTLYAYHGSLVARSQPQNRRVQDLKPYSICYVWMSSEIRCRRSNTLPLVKSESYHVSQVARSQPQNRRVQDLKPYSICCVWRPNFRRNMLQKVEYPPSGER
ncbi:hypothetical protein AVEN_25624-1 [Araneus ventricosus]|uniref:Uncharacterized protein n=1 Tax=Araneus ventricosus TaxID=182803 RepID=A0A4Y2BQR9_ARAVE|nr:hypothetical protein AVEN_25624-1 [Araneus ventricosus]